MFVNLKIAERLFVVAGALAAAGLGLAVAGAPHSVAVGLVTASAAILLAGLVSEAVAYLGPRARRGVGANPSPGNAAAGGNRGRRPVRWLRKRRSGLLLGLVVVLSLLAVSLGGLLPAAVSEGRVREFEVEAERFQYTPSVLRVDKGDHVIIRLKTRDVSHGIYLDGYGLEIKAEPGDEAVMEFDADKVGKFKFRCAVTCGPMHPFMIGELVVEPNGQFFGVTVLALVVAVGSVGYFWWQREEDHGTGG